MKKLLASAMLVALFIVMAPPAHAADPDPDPSAGLWLCQSEPVKGKADMCHATIPAFPSAPRLVTSVGGNLDKIESNDDTTGAIEKDALALGAGGITYTELNCAIGDAQGTILIGGDSYTFVYNRVGATARVSAVGGDNGTEEFDGVIAFQPKATPEELAARCTDPVAANNPLTINFTSVGPGLYLEPNPTDD
jgi:hypothetical protein